MSNEAFVGLGSNLNEPLKQMTKAIQALHNIEDITSIQTSSFYKTRAWGYEAQDDFINVVVKLTTTLDPQSLLSRLLEIEASQRRIRDIQWGPRTLDCDLLLFANEIIDEPNLQVPHPRMHLRAFVLIPLLEIWPDATLPNGQSLKTLLLSNSEQKVEKLNLKEEGLYES